MNGLCDFTAAGIPGITWFCDSIYSNSEGPGFISSGTGSEHHFTAAIRAILVGAAVASCPGNIYHSPGYR